MFADTGRPHCYLFYITLPPLIAAIVLPRPERLCSILSGAVHSACRWEEVRATVIAAPSSIKKSNRAKTATQLHQTEYYRLIPYNHHCNAAGFLVFFVLSPIASRFDRFLAVGQHQDAMASAMPTPGQFDAILDSTTGALFLGYLVASAYDLNPVALESYLTISLCIGCAGSHTLRCVFCTCGTRQTF